MHIGCISHPFLFGWIHREQHRFKLTAGAEFTKSVKACAETATRCISRSNIINVHEVYSSPPATGLMYEQYSTSLNDSM
jgi:hypothetical protein